VTIAPAAPTSRSISSGNDTTLRQPETWHDLRNLPQGVPGREPNGADSNAHRRSVVSQLRDGNPLYVRSS
jgi:hypothetical protein